MHPLNRRNDVDEIRPLQCGTPSAINRISCVDRKAATMHIVRLKYSFFAALVLACLPLFAHAELVTEWDFARGIPPGYAVQGLTGVSASEEGLVINTAQDGFIVWQSPNFSDPADVVTLRARADRPTDALLMWHAEGAAEGELVQLPFTIPAGDGTQDINIFAGRYDEWTPRPTIVGFAFPAGTNIVIERVYWRGFTAAEKLNEAWKSFWTFDTFRPYTINFLWGPLFVFNPLERAQLFDNLPPHGWSATRLFYLFIIVAAAAWIVLAFMKKNRTGALTFAAVLAACWIVFDLRMGIEFLVYAKRDIQSYVLEEGRARTLRTHGNFYAIAEEILPIVREHDRYVLVAPAESAFYPNMRYMSYPSVPLHPDQDVSGIKLWAVLNQKNLRVVDDHIVDETGRRLTSTGSVRMRFDDHTFLFELP